MGRKWLILQTMTSLIILISSIISLINAINLSKKKDYIQNLEEKLNIYESKYDEYCLEDSIEQSDCYE